MSLSLLSHFPSTVVSDITGETVNIKPHDVICTSINRCQNSWYFVNCHLSINDYNMLHNQQISYILSLCQARLRIETDTIPNNPLFVGPRLDQ